MESIDDSLYYSIDANVSGKTICFDLDWTLVYGNKHMFPKLPSDIHLLPGRRAKLKYLADRGWHFVIFTNQFCRGAKDLANKLARVKHFVDESEFKWSYFIATKKDEFRKPNIGMWEQAKKLMPNADFRRYVGDAAGRPQDFANSDKEFAENADIKFITPEIVFKPKLPTIVNQGKTMVVLVGMPGSGKTSYYKEHLKPLGFNHINQDSLKTVAMVKKKVIEFVNNSDSFCVDNLNNRLDKRTSYYELATAAGYKIITVYLVRDGRGWNNLRDHKVPSVVYNVYFKKLVEPTSSNTPGTLHLIS